MKNKLRFLTCSSLFIFLLLVTSDSIFAQLRTEFVDGDTVLIFTQPMRDRFEEQVNAKVTKNNSLYSYEFIVKNDSISDQRIWLWVFFKDAEVEQINSPANWRAIYRGDPKGLQWGANQRDSEIGSGESLAGFSFTTRFLPTIKNYYMEGWAQFILTEEPDSVENSSFFDVVKKGVTIFPRDEQILSQSQHIDTLNTYLNRSCEELGWITNQGICNSLEVKLNNVKKHLEDQKPKQAANVLHAFLHEVNAQKDKALSSEAYALLFFNGEYLLELLEGE